MRIKRVDASLDRQIITGMVVSTEFIKAIQPIYSPAYMVAPYAITVAKWCMDYFKEYGKAPGKDIQEIFYSEERNGGIDDNQMDLISQFLESLSEEHERSNALNVDFLLNETEKCFRTRELKQMALDVMGRLDSGDLDGAEDLAHGYRRLRVSTSLTKGYTAEELQQMEIREPAWVIEGIIPEGLTLLAGKAKVGKSLFLLDAAIGVALGSNIFGCVPTTPASVLYLALEEPNWRMKHRLNQILGDNPWPPNLHIHPNGGWQRIHQGGLDDLEEWMEKYPDTRLIVVDTLEKVKRVQKVPSHHYSEDYNNLAPLQTFATKHQIAVVVVHHTKKTSTKDLFDEITGTVGLTAAADTLAILASNGKGRILSFRGRDVGEEELFFSFDNCRYTLECEAVKEDSTKSLPRRLILKYLWEADGVVSREELVDGVTELGAGKGVDSYFPKMVADRQIRKVKHGYYARKGYMTQEEQDSARSKIFKHLNRIKA